jgi:UDP-glucose:(heptosyl)LPS alpha-1,3-glucosyltransferase
MGRRIPIIALSSSQRKYLGAWGTEPDRVFLLPSILEPERRQPERRDGTREKRRNLLGLRGGDWCWLAIGNQPHNLIARLPPLLSSQRPA